MSYLTGVLSALAAIFIAAFVSIWPSLRGSKATGLAVLLASPLSLRFWIVGILVFGVFFAASRGSTILRVLFFWIPTLVVSALGFAFLGLLTYVVAISRHQ
jgi:hypothetical protein